MLQGITNKDSEFDGDTIELKHNLQDDDKFEDDNTIIKPQKQVQLKRKKFGIGYDRTKLDFFHIPNYSKPMKFVSDAFLDDDLKMHIIDFHKLDEVPQLKDHHAKQEDKDDDVAGDDVAGDDEDETLDIAKLDYIPKQCQLCH